MKKIGIYLCCAAFALAFSMNGYAAELDQGSNLGSATAVAGQAGAGGAAAAGTTAAVVTTIMVIAAVGLSGVFSSDDDEGPPGNDGGPQPQPHVPVHHAAHH